MNYYIDFEFIEGFKKPLFGKRRHFIDMISVGIYCEDGRSYHCLSSEWNYKDASQWVKDNVILPIYKQGVVGDSRNRFSCDNFHKYYGKPNSEIAKEIIEFVMNPRKDNGDGTITLTLNVSPVFYGYFADYDWVLFCSIFGRMIDLPQGFPMYCRDLKQMLDEKVESIKKLPIRRKHYSLSEDGSCLEEKKEATPKDSKIDLSKYSFRNKLSLIKSLPGYPKNNQEHTAAYDAKWNYDLHQFIKSL